MHFDNFDIEIGVESLGDTPCHGRQEVYAKAHVSGFDYGGMAPGCRYCCFLIGAKTGCADHMDNPSVGSEPGEFHRGCWLGEIQYGVNAGAGCKCVVGDLCADFTDSCQRADILTKELRAGLLNAPGDNAAMLRMHGADKFPAHASARAHDGDLDIAHSRLPSPFACHSRKSVHFTTA